MMAPTTEAMNRRETFLQALADYLTVSLTPGDPGHNAAAHTAMIAALDRVLTLPERGVFTMAVEELFVASWEEGTAFGSGKKHRIHQRTRDAKAALIALVFGQEAGE